MLPFKSALLMVTSLLFVAPAFAVSPGLSKSDLQKKVDEFKRKCSTDALTSSLDKTLNIIAKAYPERPLSETLPKVLDLSPGVSSAEIADRLQLSESVSDQVADAFVLKEQVTLAGGGFWKFERECDQLFVEKQLKRLLWEQRNQGEQSLSQFPQLPPQKIIDLKQLEIVRKKFQELLAPQVPTHDFKLNPPEAGVE